MILHEEEKLTRQKLEKLQLERLRNTLATVYNNVPFYRKVFAETSGCNLSIQHVNEIKNYPFTTKEDLRTHYPFGFFAADKSRIVRLHASSGTSGKPTVVGYTRKDIEVWSSVVARAISMAGGKEGEILHNAYGYGLFTGGLGLHYGSEKLGMVTVPVSGGNTERQIRLIQDFKPSIICGTPSYTLNIAEKMEQAGISPGENSLRFGILGAEPWSEKMRSVLEKKMGIQACDIYGLSEVMGPGVAMECSDGKNGLHIAEDHFLAEVIDPVTLENVGDGEDGELVFTSLTKEALPLIRYRTGDIASITKEPCICGRTTARMSRIKGRIDDMLIVRGVNVYPSEIEHQLLTSAEVVPHYQLYVNTTGSMDTVTLNVEVTEIFYKEASFSVNSDHSQKLAKRIEQQLKASLMLNIQVAVCAPSTLPRSEGKAVRVIDRRKLNSYT
ncbi:phenylacetate--CoA ligase family protein [Jeotgalibacillus proteolyticus]|uniref:Phenylacetate-coenzyme A ligase n=1 Tax=Jeotgalibacillus proteolyticus TaxID=2082395 RepID=A0A2S5GH34_9BACL|nr:AMP-binding protein [Jeotgalibacillus proteolyticus]PPA72286.1 phenylacetate--CoA ligase [Jeotgalibacillus proteolyticus]